MIKSRASEVDELQDTILKLCEENEMLTEKVLRLQDKLNNVDRHQVDIPKQTIINLDASTSQNYLEINTFFNSSLIITIMRRGAGGMSVYWNGTEMHI